MTPHSSRADLPVRRPSAALVLGILSGALAAATILPTVLPLTWRIGAAEETLAVRHVQDAVSIAARALERDATLRQGLAAQLQVDHVHVETGGVSFDEGVGLPEEVVVAACADPTGAHDLGDSAGSHWVAACRLLDKGGGRLVVAVRPNYGAARQVGYLILALSAMVGIITALGVLRLLSPLSAVSRALARVEAGERGVKVQSSGLAELDELVDRLNAAARAMEEREDAITSRIQVVQEMARLVAHEVRNPLQTLELLTSLIASEDDLREREELAASIRAEIGALDHVVTRMLREGSARGALRLQRQAHQVGPLLEQVVSLRGPEARARGVVLKLGPVSDRVISVDAALVGRSIENLVLNALQAVADGEGVVCASVVEQYPNLLIEVEDNGPGVDEVLGKAVFEADVTSKSSGTGLGLALVRGVLEAHGGEVRYDCSPTLGGARFVASLPIEAPVEDVNEST